MGSRYIMEAAKSLVILPRSLKSKMVIYSTFVARGQISTEDTYIINILVNGKGVNFDEFDASSIIGTVIPPFDDLYRWRQVHIVFKNITDYDYKYSTDPIIIRGSEKLVVKFINCKNITIKTIDHSKANFIMDHLCSNVVYVKE